MKFALIDDKKVEPSKGAKGFCPNCGAELVAKCGEIKVHHWAHKGIRNCDPWWENETEWHRFWKNHFPLEWQEVIHKDKTGERHIADVKTDEDWVLEFQHSPITSEERNSRNIFYSKIVWIVDGLRLIRDKTQFENVLKSGSRLMYGHIPIFRIGAPFGSRLLREWSGLNISVFFDFQESRTIDNSRLWLLIPTKTKDIAYILAFSGKEFIEIHNKKGYNEMAFDIIPNIVSFLTKRQMNRSPVHYILPRRRSRRSNRW